jgi:hypothetical protein
MIRADLSDQTVVEGTIQMPVTATERYKRHGHYPALILVEGNPALATRLERALFDDHFEVLHVTGEDEPLHILESSLSLTQSIGLVVIYSCGSLDPEAKRRLSTLVANRFFDVSAMQLPDQEPDAVQILLSLLKPLRAMADHKDQDQPH